MWSSSSVVYSIDLFGGCRLWPAEGAADLVAAEGLD